MQTNLLKPKAIQVEPLGDRRAKVTLEPFERGYGHTLGNALRRVLLSSMVGYAPTEVTIAGVLHEYSTVDGVQEDVVHIMLNLKGVTFKLHNRDEVTLVLRKEGEGPVTAGDIQTPHDVEVINPDHVIAHLAKGGKLDMQIKVEKGRGYVPGNLRRFGDEPTKAIGRIVLDASFSPVRRVSYAVENARVEQRTDLDKLVMEIETNGAMSPEEGPGRLQAAGWAWSFKPSRCSAATWDWAGGRTKKSRSGVSERHRRRSGWFCDGRIRSRLCSRSAPWWSLRSRRPGCLRLLPPVARRPCWRFRRRCC